MDIDNDFTYTEYLINDYNRLMKLTDQLLAANNLDEIYDMAMEVGCVVVALEERGVDVDKLMNAQR